MIGEEKPVRKKQRIDGWWRHLIILNYAVNSDCKLILISLGRCFRNKYFKLTQGLNNENHPVLCRKCWHFEKLNVLMAEKLSLNGGLKIKAGSKSISMLGLAAFPAFSPDVMVINVATALWTSQSFDVKYKQVTGRLLQRWWDVCFILSVLSLTPSAALLFRNKPPAWRCGQHLKAFLEF